MFLSSTEANMWELKKFVIPKIEAEWKDLAYCMKFKLERIEAIEKDSKDQQKCCERLLTDWLTTSDPKPKTYKNLLKYIKKIDKLTAVSKTIEKDLIEGKGKQTV